MNVRQSKEHMVQSIVEERRRLLKNRLREQTSQPTFMNNAFPRSPSASSGTREAVTPHSARSCRSAKSACSGVSSIKSADWETLLTNAKQIWTPTVSHAAQENTGTKPNSHHRSSSARPARPRPAEKTARRAPSLGAKRSSVVSASSMDLGDKASLWTAQYRRGLELRQRLKKEKEKVEISECTFRPKIRSSMLREPQKEHTDRLYHEADLKKKVREKAKLLLEMEEAVAHTFTPKTCTYSGKMPSSPFLTRVDDSIKKQKQNILRKQMHEDRKEDCTFTPSISTRSEQIIQRKRSDALRKMEDVDILEPVENRLYNMQYKERKVNKEDSTASTSGMKYGTQMAPKTEEIIKTSVFFQGPYKNFLQRQQAFQDAKEQRVEYRIKSEMPVCPKENIDSIGERMRRMGPCEHERRMKVRRLKDEQNFEEECPFKPEINAASRSYARDYVFKRLSQKKKEVKPEPPAVQYSFQPAVDPTGRYSHVSSHYDMNTVSQQIKRDQQERELKLDQLRMQEDKKEAKGCTFQPTIRNVPKDVYQRKAIAGLDRFMELQKMARQRKEEKELKKPKAANGYVGITVPEPFRLSCKRKCRQSDVVQEDIKRNWDECTFHPDTVERQKQEMIRKILVSG